MQKSKSRIKTEKDRTLADFLFEAVTLKRLKRTGWQILGANEESIAEHSFMVCVISYVLAVELNADKEKVLVLALFHDFAEARTGDVYKLADFYVKTDEKKAVLDAFDTMPQKEQIIKILKNYREKDNLEIKIVHDADTLSLCIELKILMEKGDSHAGEWFEANIKRLKLKQSKKLAKEIKKTNSQNWWKQAREKIHKDYSG